jgi:predicted transcriptional regulator of viral defense system
MKTLLIWEKMLIEDRKIVTSDEIRELSEQLGKEPKQSLNYLQRHGFITRILRGIFYVKSYEERKKGQAECSLYDMLAMALETKGVRKWYFGMETALKFNLMTHEYFTVDRVITDSFRTTKVIKINGTNFSFIRWNERHFDRGIVTNGRIRYSDKEKTVLDLIYRDYLNGKEKFTDAYSEYVDQLSKERFMDYLSDYPPRFREAMEGMI